MQRKKETTSDSDFLNYNPFMMVQSVFRRVMCTILLLTGGHLLSAQENNLPDTVSAKAPFDTSQLRLRAPSAKHLDSFRNDREFNYQHDAPPPENPLAKLCFSFFLI
mgnify:FL=1